MSCHLYSVMDAVSLCSTPVSLLHVRQLTGVVWSAGDLGCVSGLEPGLPICVCFPISIRPYAITHKQSETVVEAVARDFFVVY